MDSHLGTCSNCNKQFENSKVQLHEAYCLRNFRKCPQCDEFVDKNELQAHNAEKHTRQSCKYHCGQELLDSEVDSHLKICKRKPQRCSFCGLDIDSLELDDHISHCGARTKECMICRKSIILFDYESHEEHCVGTKDNMFPKILDSLINEQQMGIGQEEKLRKKKEEQLVQKTRNDIEEIKQKKLFESENREIELAEKIKQANSSGDKELMKRLQLEQDELIAQEWQKQFSPKKDKQKLEQQQQFFSKNEEEEEDDDGYDYHYNYYQEEEEDNYNHDEDENHEQDKDVAYNQREKVNGNNLPTQVQEDMGQYCDDPELQEAILRSTQLV